MVEAFFDELSDGFCVSDAHGNILYLNPAGKRLLGVSGGHVRGKNICTILSCHRLVDGSGCSSPCELLKPGSEATAVTFRGKPGPLNLRVRCLKASPTLIGAGRLLTLIEDVSAETEHERQKEDWRQMIAHDLRSPLTSVYATIRLVQEAAGEPLPAGGDAVVESAARSCRKMMDLITLYLDVAKFDAGVAEIRPAPVRLAAAVRTEIAAQDAVARDKKLEISSTVPEEIVVSADPDLLSRVVQNVLDNAVKFTPAGGRVVLSARVSGGRAELSIKDSGPGIAPEEVPLLFDRYHQARARRAGKIQGTGLGLTFCREALKLMGGGIAAGSKPGEGAEFVIRLSLAAPVEKPRSKEAPRALQDLAREHADFEKLIERLEARAGGDGDSARRALRHTLLILLAAMDKHDKVEHVVFGDPGDASGEDAQRAIAQVDLQHRNIQALRLEFLGAIAGSDSLPIQRLKFLVSRLAESLRTHIKTEEELLWPHYENSGRALDASILRRIERDVEDLERDIAADGAAAPDIPKKSRRS